MSFAAFGLVTKLYIWPWLRTIPRDDALVALIVPHAFRFIGGTSFALVTVAARAQGGSHPDFLDRAVTYCPALPQTARRVERERVSLGDAVTGRGRWRSSLIGDSRFYSNSGASFASTSLVIASGTCSSLRPFRALRSSARGWSHRTTRVVFVPAPVSETAKPAVRANRPPVVMGTTMGTLVT